MFKATATKVALFAFDTTTGAAKTGDAANITAYVSKDYGAVTQLGDTSATELDATNAKGWYLFDVTGTEATADALLFTGKSTTANISVVGQVIFTTPIRFSSLVIDAAGLADANAVKVGPSGAGTAQTAGDIPARLPAALVSGRIDASVGAMAANVLTATAINADAITAAKIADGAIDAATFAAGAINAAAIAADAITAAKVADGTIDAATFAAGAINAAAIAADAITDAKVAADVTIASVTGAVGSVTGSVGSVVGAVGSVTGLTAADVGAIKLKTDNLPSDPADESLIIDATTAIMSRLGAPVGASTSADIAAVKADSAAIKIQTDKLTFTVANQLDVNVLDWKSSAAPAMTGDAYAALTGGQSEPGQGAPAVNASPLVKVSYLFKAWRNLTKQTATEYDLYADDGVTIDQKATVSDDGVTFTRGEIASGP